jgi:U3 small nucleolar RNA-associated protein 18
MPSSKKSKKHQSPLVAAALGENGGDANMVKKKRKRSDKEIEEDAEERRLTALLFGGAGEAPDEDDEDDEEHVVTQTLTDSSGAGGALFELDTSGDADDDMQLDDVEDEDIEDADDNQEEEDDDDDDDDKTVWEDEDDVELDLLKTNRLKKLRNYRDEDVSSMKGKDLEKRLRKRFATTTMATARTDWANVDNEAEEEEATSAAPLLATTSKKLPPQILQVVRCQDANQKDPNQAAVQAVHFHPGSDPDRPLMLTAGLDKTLRFFQVGAEGSDKIHGIHFPKLPIYSAQFLGDTGNVVVSGRRSFFYIYDAAVGKLDLVPKIMGREEKSLEKFTTSPDGKTIAFIGNDGYIILVDVKSKQWIADLKMNGSARAATFTPNSEYLIASGSDGDVYRFDMRSRRCVERYSNEDGTITSSLSASFKHLAVGAESGVVNLYSDRKTKDRAPIKSIMNLKTSADFSRFNHDGQILAFSTRREKNGLKLLHVPTATVFSNWPTSKTPLNYAWSLDFSPESKFLAIGNDKGNCLLYKLLHYHDK